MPQATLTNPEGIFGQEKVPSSLPVSTNNTTSQTSINAPSVVTSTQAKNSLNNIKGELGTIETGMQDQNVLKAQKAQADAIAKLQAEQAGLQARSKKELDDRTLASGDKTNQLLEGLKTQMDSGATDTSTYKSQASDSQADVTKDQELNKAYQRVQQGTGTETDMNNINYAQGKGWMPGQTPTETVTEPTTDTRQYTSDTTQSPAESTVEPSGTPVGTVIEGETDAQGHPLYDRDGNPTPYKTLQDLDEAQADYQAKMESITNGTFPLTAGEQAQINDMRESFDRMIKEQRLANKNYEGATTKLGITSGRSRYAGEEEIGNIQTAINLGVQKVTDIEKKALSSIRSLKDAIRTKNYKSIEFQYKNVTEFLKQKSDIIDKINSNTAASLKAIQDQANKDREYNLNVEKYLSGEMRADELAIFNEEKAIADYTGQFRGAETRQSKLDYANLMYKELGLDLDERKFDEMIKNNTFERDYKEQKLALDKSKQAAETAGINVGEMAKKYLNGDTTIANNIPKSQKMAFDAALSKQKDLYRDAYKETNNIEYVMRNSAGGKPLIGADQTKLANIQSMGNTLIDLQSAVESMQEKGKSGAWKGRITERKFWEEDVATINAQINALIPGLARGIFGEVGVLTDSDVKRYRNTIADISTPEDAVKDIMGSLAKNLVNTMDATLASAAANHKDVSLYTDIRDSAIESAIQMGYDSELLPKKSTNVMLYDNVDSYTEAISEEMKKELVDDADANGVSVQDYFQLMQDKMSLNSSEQDFNNVGGDTQTEPTGDVTNVNIGGRNISVDSSIADKVSKAEQDFFNATGQHIKINESFRTAERQQELYDKLSKTGAQVAPPGYSFHEKGLAIDVANWEEAEPYLRAMGFKNDLANDKGHFSIGEFA